MDEIIAELNNNEGGIPPMTFKNNLTLLSEAATIDLKMDTEEALRFDTVREAYDAIPEMNEDVVTEASDVVVLNTRDGEYYVEFVNLAPFMKDSGITDIAEALDLVASANGLNSRDVGLVIESQYDVDAYLEAAKKKSNDTRNSKTVKNAMNKVSKSTSTSKALMDKGYKVKKKSKNSKVCPKCGKAVSKCKCECGDMSSGAASPSVPKHGNVSEMFENMSYETYEAIQEQLTDTINAVFSEQIILNEGVLDATEGLIKSIIDWIIKAGKYIAAKAQAAWEWIKTQCRKIKNKVIGLKDKYTKVTVELYDDKVQTFMDKTKAILDQFPGWVSDVMDAVKKGIENNTNGAELTGNHTTFANAGNQINKNFHDVGGENLSDMSEAAKKAKMSVDKYQDEIMNTKFKKTSKTLSAQEVLKEIDKLEQWSKDLEKIKVAATPTVSSSNIGRVIQQLKTQDTAIKHQYNQIKTIVLNAMGAVRRAVEIITKCIAENLKALNSVKPDRGNDYYEDQGYSHRNAEEKKTSEEPKEDKKEESK